MEEETKNQLFLRQSLEKLDYDQSVACSLMPGISLLRVGSSFY